MTDSSCTPKHYHQVMLAWDCSYLEQDEVRRGVVPVLDLNATLNAHHTRCIVPYGRKPKLWLKLAVVSLDRDVRLVELTKNTPQGTGEIKERRRRE